MILLDTHVLIWLAIEPSRLSRKAAETIPSAGRERGIAISAITLWELAWLATHGKAGHNQHGGSIRRQDHFKDRNPAHHAANRGSGQSTSVQLLRGDPCNRLIGATALAGAFLLVTKDRNIRGCKQIKTSW